MTHTELAGAFGAKTLCDWVVLELRKEMHHHEIHMFCFSLDYPCPILNNTDGVMINIQTR